MLKRLAPPLLLTALGLVFFAELVAHPTGVLYSDHSDALAEHNPAKRFWVRSWQETGELPRWFPYNFAGGPFLHDIQVEAFYPPHWLLLPLPESLVGPAVGWLVCLHVLIAGWCMYAYARGQGLGRAASVVAGAGYMFAGKWLLHLLAGGHYVVAGVAWLPLVLLLLEQALRRRSLPRATAAGAVYGLFVLGTHPQWTLYGSILIALWTLGTALESAGYLGGEGERSRRRAAAALARWAGYGAWVAALGVALAAVQLLPTLEASPESSRSVGVGAANGLEGGLRTLLFLFGPALNTDAPILAWEDRGGFGVLWVAAAALAPLLCRGRVRFQAAVCLGLLLFSFGGGAAFHSLPGFRLFGREARMILVAALPVALLAGVTTQALFAGAAPAAEDCRRCRRVLTRILAGALILVGGLALRLALTGQAVLFHPYWVTLLVTVPAAFWLLGAHAGRDRLRLARAWALVLLIDLWGLAWPLVRVRPEADVYVRSRCLDYLAENGRGHGRVLDRDVPGWVAGTPLGSGAPLAVLGRLESLRGCNSLDVLRYKEYLHLAGDNAEPLRPFGSTLTYPVIANFPVKDKVLLDLLGVRYLVQAEAEGPAPAGWRLALEDPGPVAYDFIAGGVRQLPPYRVYENDPDSLFPRAFVVPRAEPLPERPRVLEALKGTDFREVVLLEDFTPAAGSKPVGRYRPAAVTTYQPNRVVIDLDGGPPGYLVLTDVWYPGWACTVDGRPARIHRGDFLFRAVALPGGARQAVFTFAPASYTLGRTISLAALGVVGAAALVALLRGRLSAGS